MPSQHRRAAVLGRPIAHSLSPVLHRAAYRALGLEGWEYDRREVGEEELAAFLDGLDPTWAGLSLTMPLKRTVMAHGAPANRWARELGVANTVTFDWDATGAPRLALANTDVYGIARAFGEHGAAWPGGRAVILGNGNTAMSALAAYAMMGGVTQVTVGARRPERTTGMEDFARRHGMRLTVVPLDAAAGACALADLAVNTIPGHGADPFARRLAADARPVRGTLLDVVYDPRPTALMDTWHALGGQAIGGQWMLLYQAVAQVMLMTGMGAGTRFDSLHDAPRHPELEAAMGRALEEAL
ncbi:MAG: shikimate dehydrogenase [Bifidobacterium sp.]|nr:shikimate dehydrogenase [Bifidobacterium sp.]